ncbi:MAG: CoA transferase [Thermonema sp.]|nr:MAG: CoA transferase [Thermonema sp.]
MVMQDIFRGLKVIELANVLAGPSVGQFFAELGAQVIKVENARTGGDVTRSWLSRSETPNPARISAYFCCANFGKQSIVLDLQKEEDKQLLYSYVQDADIVLASYKAGDAQKLGVDYETLRTLNPLLIYGHITGYGKEDERVGYDAIIQAEAGFTYLNGESSGGPVKMPVALIDVLAAHQLKEGLLIALWQRERLRKGAYVHVSLFEAAVASLANQATNYLNTGTVPRRLGSEHPNIVPYGTVFPTADNKKIVLAVGTDKQFRALCQVLGMSTVAEDRRFRDNAARVHHRNELLPLLRQAILQWNKDELLQALRAHKIPAGAVNRMDEVFQTPQAQKLILQHPHTPFKGLRQLVAQIEGYAWHHPSPPPPYQEPPRTGTKPDAQ